MHKTIIFLLLLIFVGCGTMNQLNKYKGLPIETIKKELGEPTYIIPVNNGNRYIYETTTTLQSTEISKGQTTLDPIVSPASVKTEKIIFMVINGKVISAEKETEYTRK